MSKTRIIVIVAVAVVVGVLCCGAVACTPIGNSVPGYHSVDNDSHKSKKKKKKNKSTKKNKKNKKSALAADLHWSTLVGK